MNKFNIIYPVTKRFNIVSQWFGENLSPIYKNMGLDGHNGIDFVCPTGTPIYAVHDGEVTYTGEDGSGGQMIVLRTYIKYPYDGAEVYFKTIYGHLQKEGGILVKAGQGVATGDLIGLSDNTGMSTNPHLHFGMKPVMKGEDDWSWWNYAQKNGYLGAIDPKPYFDNYYPEDIVIMIKIISLIKDFFSKWNIKN